MRDCYSYRMIDTQIKMQTTEKYSVPKALEHWIDTHITTPIKGFDHKKKADGSYYTKEEQLSATRYQVITIAKYFLERGRSIHEVLRILIVFTG